MRSIPLSGIEGGNSARFENLGDTYVGRITDIDERQQTNPATRQPVFFPSGDPMMVYLITIEQADGERATLWARKGNFKIASGEGQAMLNAISAAGRDAGAEEIEIGGELAVQFTGMGEQQPGKNAPKLYTAQYKVPPKAAIPTDLFNS